MDQEKRNHAPIQLSPDTPQFVFDFLDSNRSKPYVSNDDLPYKYKLHQMPDGTYGFPTLLTDKVKKSDIEEIMNKAQMAFGVVFMASSLLLHDYIKAYAWPITLVALAILFGIRFLSYSEKMFQRRQFYEDLLTKYHINLLMLNYFKSVSDNKANSMFASLQEMQKVVNDISMRYNYLREHCPSNIVEQHDLLFNIETPKAGETGKVH